MLWGVNLTPMDVWMDFGIAGRICSDVYEFGRWEGWNEEEGVR